jgi:hypothetical protein
MTHVVFEWQYVGTRENGKHLSVSQFVFLLEVSA